MHCCVASQHSLPAMQEAFCWSQAVRARAAVSHQCNCMFAIFAAVTTPLLDVAAPCGAHFVCKGLPLTSCVCTCHVMQHGSDTFTFTPHAVGTVGSQRCPLRQQSNDSLPACSYTSTICRAPSAQPVSGSARCQPHSGGSAHESSPTGRPCRDNNAGHRCCSILLWLYQGSAGFCSATAGSMG